MFENIIGHGDLVARLSADLRSGVLPRAILLSGPAYTGKLTVALELARVLTCDEEDAPWNCGCTNCRRQRLLIHPETLLLGSRYFLQELTLTRRVLLETRSTPGAYLFVRAMRKLTRRFDPPLWEGEENRLSKIASALNEIDEGLRAIEPPRELAEGEKLAQDTEALIQKAEKVASAIPSDPIAIHHVRNASAWAHLSGGSRNKVIILENAEQMNESGRNALLKTLEEPPSNVYFILTCSRRSAMIATILSRVRDYRLSPRSPEEERRVMERVFRDQEQPETSVRSYFLRSTFDYKVSMGAIVSHVLRELGDDGAGGMQELMEAMSQGDPRGVFRYFCEELTRIFRERLMESASAGRSAALESTEIIAELDRIVADHLARVETRNMSPKSTAESLFLALRRRYPRSSVV
jgi:DNA polymerase III delta prime subunit